MMVLFSGCGLGMTGNSAALSAGINLRHSFLSRSAARIIHWGRELDATFEGDMLRRGFRAGLFGRFHGLLIRLPTEFAKVTPFTGITPVELGARLIM